MSLKQYYTKICVILCLVCAVFLNDAKNQAAKNVKITNITITNVKNSKLTLEEDTTYRLKTSIAPKTATNQTLKWKSSDSSTVRVSRKGNLRGLKVGKATITATATDGSKKKASITVTVTKSKDTGLEKLSGLVAHMGYSSKEPANSMPAFERASKNGFVGIECDVSETKDGRFVIYHDNNLNTRTNGTGTIATKTYAQIQTLRLTKGNNIKSYRNLRIPTLEQVLKLCKETNKVPILHIKNIKSTSYTRIIQLLKDYDMIDQAVIIAGKTVVSRFRALNSEVQLAWVCYMSKSGIDWAAKNNIQINTDYTYVTTNLVNYAHSKGLKVGAWTVNKSTTAKTLIRQGVDFITTDYLLNYQ